MAKFLAFVALVNVGVHEATKGVVRRGETRAGGSEMKREMC